jgi:uncharacterized PurR-regulated membrane protein YhhQ (DUF165 family)
MAPEPRLDTLRQKAAALGYLMAFITCIPAANWMIGHVGTVCDPPYGPCLVPVWPWGPNGTALLAPSGVLLIGIALVLRDMVQRRLGRAAALTAIVAGALLSGAVAPPALVYASAAAFLLSEFADFAVYTPLQDRGLVLAVLASSVVGLIADSVLFLWLAFDSLDLIEGQVLGKLWMVLLALPFIHWVRKRELRRALKWTAA